MNTREQDKLDNSPTRFLDKERIGVRKARYLPQSKVHICTMVGLSFQAPLHPFHANHFWCDQPFWHFDILLPMFHGIDRFYPLTAEKIEVGVFIYK